MSNIHNKGNIRNQINNPEKVVINEGRKILHLLTQIPKTEDEVIGRDKDIQRLKEALESAQQVVLMNGLGGIGKTTIAIAYVQQYKAEYTHIVWLEDLDDFSTDTASNSVLTGNLGITPTKDTVTDTQRILNTLSNLSGPSLLVIDNAHQSLQSFKSYLPQAPNWQVLITSREELPFAKTISLGFLSEEKALELFHSHYNRDQDDARVKAICAAIDYHTLTIELLAKTAQKLRITPLNKLSDLLEEKGIQIDRNINLVNVSHSQGEQVEKLFPYLKAIFQLDDSISKEEIQLLKQFVALPPNFTPFHHLRSFLQIEEDSETYDTFISTLDQLKTKGWLSHDPAQDAYKMHRIIQEVMESHLQPSLEDVQALVESVSDALYSDYSKENPIDKFSLIPFGERIITLFKAVDSKILAELFNHLGEMHKYKGQYQRSKKLRLQALNWYQSTDEVYQLDKANLQSDLAVVLQYLGEYQEAKELLRKAVNYFEKKLGNEHPNTAKSYSNLALVLKEQGKYQEAKELLQKVVSSYEQNYGEEHSYTVTSYSNLAVLLKDLGELPQAEQLLRKVVRSDEKNLGKEHLNTARSYSILAAVLKDLGELHQAKDLFEKAVALNEKNLGEEHPFTTNQYSNLAIVLKSLGELQEAKKLLQKAVSADEKNLGKEHPKTAVRYSNLARVLQGLGEFQKAIKLYTDSLKVMKAALGDQHPSVKTISEAMEECVEVGVEAGNAYCLQLKGGGNGKEK